MKTIIILCFALNLSASIPDTLIPYQYPQGLVEFKMTKRDMWLWGGNTALSFISGLSYGVREVVQHKPNRIPTSWNQQWWDTRLSWTNKYWQNDPAEGRNHIPVVFTDAYHTAGTIHRWSTMGAGICIGLGSNNSWKHILADALWSFICFQVGFTISYRTDIFFRQY
jgi:hypothetical protein